MNFIDQNINNDALIICKCLIPYLTGPKQKNMAILAKSLELFYTMQLFQSDDFVRSISKEVDIGWEKDFLRDLQHSISKEKSYLIDALLKLTEIHSILDNKTSPLSKQPSSSSIDSQSSNDVINKFAPLLEPNQVQLLKILSNFIKPS